MKKWVMGLLLMGNHVHSSRMCERGKGREGDFIGCVYYSITELLYIFVRKLKQQVSRAQKYHRKQ